MKKSIENTNTTNGSANKTMTKRGFASDNLLLNDTISEAFSINNIVGNNLLQNNIINENFSKKKLTDPEWEEYKVAEKETPYGIAGSLKSKYNANLAVPDIVSAILKYNHTESLKANSTIYVPTLLYFKNHGGITDVETPLTQDQKVEKTENPFTQTENHTPSSLLPPKPVNNSKSTDQNTDNPFSYSKQDSNVSSSLYDNYGITMSKELLKSWENGEDYLDQRITEDNASAATNKYKLGSISGLEKIPSQEAFWVKLYVYQHFQNGNRQVDFERDVIVYNSTLDKMYYTFRFHPATESKFVDVSIERIGGSEIDPEAFDIANTPGYPATGDVTQLENWLTKRFKIDGKNAKGNTAEEMRISMNYIIQSKMGTKDWYMNYDISFPGAEAAKAIMSKMPEKSNPAAQKNIIPFESQYLKFIELSLINMSNPVIDKIRKTSIIRQKVYLNNNGTRETNSGYATEDPKNIILFDTAFENDDLNFLGGKKGIKPRNNKTITHEFGHIASFQPNGEEGSKQIIAIFDAFIENNNSLKAMTSYSQVKKGEIFAEAFYLYYNDPEYLKNNHSKIFNWIDTLNKTGMAPTK